MNIRILIVLLVFFIEQVNGQSKKDTVFIFRNGDSVNSQTIFIDNPQSNSHRKVFQLLLSDTTEYHERLSVVKSLGLIHKLALDQNVSGDWISVYSYKGLTYGYFPSEPFFNLFIRVTDSCIIINDFNEGLVPFAIKSVLRRKNNYIFQIIDGFLKESRLTFKIERNGVVVNSPLFNQRNIRIARKDEFLALKIIVNNCPDHRCNEFDFK